MRQGRLQWIHSSAAGLDHCLVPAVIDSPIVVSSSSGLFADQVAEQTLCLLLAQLRNLPTFLRAQQLKQFERRPTDDLHGKTVGIVGFGGNGRRIARGPLDVESSHFGNRPISDKEASRTSNSCGPPTSYLSYSPKPMS